MTSHRSSHSTRPEVRLHLLRHSLSNETVSSDLTIASVSTGVISQVGARWKHDYATNINSGFGAGSPRSENKKSPREGREKGVPGMPSEYGPGRTGKPPAPVPASMLRALGLRTSADMRERPDAEIAMPEAVNLLLQKQRSDARDGEIEAAVHDLIGSIEYITEQFDKWDELRLWLGQNDSQSSPLRAAKLWKFQHEKLPIQKQLGVLKEDINLLEVQERAKELYGDVIESCQADVAQMDFEIQSRIIQVVGEGYTPRPEPQLRTPWKVKGLTSAHVERNRATKRDFKYEIVPLAAPVVAGSDGGKSGIPAAGTGGRLKILPPPDLYLREATLQQLNAEKADQAPREEEADVMLDAMVKATAMPTGGIETLGGTAAPASPPGGKSDATKSCYDVRAIAEESQATAQSLTILPQLEVQATLKEIGQMSQQNIDSEKLDAIQTVAIRTPPIGPPGFHDEAKGLNGSENVQTKAPIDYMIMLDDLSRREEILREAIAKGIMLLNRPAEPKFEGSIERLQRCMAVFCGDLEAFQESMEEDQKEVDAEDIVLVESCQSLSKSAKEMQESGENMIRMLDEAAKMEKRGAGEARRPRRRNTMEQMSWMKPLRASSARFKASTNDVDGQGAGATGGGADEDQENATISRTEVPSSSLLMDNVGSIASSAHDDDRNRETDGSDCFSEHPGHRVLEEAEAALRLVNEPRHELQSPEDEDRDREMVDSNELEERWDSRGADDTKTHRLPIKPTNLVVRSAEHDDQDWETDHLEDADDHPYQGQPKHSSAVWDDKKLNNIRIRGLRCWQHQQHLNTEVDMLETALGSHPQEVTSLHVENCMEMLNTLLSAVRDLDQDLRQVPDVIDVARLAKNVFGVDEQVSAMILTLLYAEHEQERRERSRRDRRITETESPAEIDLTPNAQPTLRPRPLVVSRDSGYFDTASEEEERIAAAEKKQRKYIALDTIACDRHWTLEQFVKHFAGNKARMQDLERVVDKLVDRTCDVIGADDDFAETCSKVWEGLRDSLAARAEAHDLISAQ